MYKSRKKVQERRQLKVNSCKDNFLLCSDCEFGARETERVTLFHQRFVTLLRTEWSSFGLRSLNLRQSRLAMEFKILCGSTPAEVFMVLKIQ